METKMKEEKLSAINLFVRFLFSFSHFYFFIKFSLLDSLILFSVLVLFLFSLFGAKKTSKLGVNCLANL